MMTAAEFVRDDIEFRLDSVAPSARNEFIYYTAGGELIGLRKDG